MLHRKAGTYEDVVKHDALTTARETSRTTPRMAIIHEWIAARAGSEQVFEAMAATFPAADLIALTVEPGVRIETGGRPIRTTFLDRHGMRRHRAMTLPLMPIAWRTIGRGEYDVVLTSHHAFAHCHRLADSVHLAYVHSPARYLWSPEIDERGSGRLLAPVRSALRRVDVAASRRVTAYAANSTAVARRVREAWGRDANVIHPPVRVEFFAIPSPVAPTRDYILGAGRWIPYKNLHLVIQAGERAGLPVKIAGSGPDKPRLRAAAEAARVPVDLIESPTDVELRELYRNAVCLVFPTVEDFGLVAVEAQAAGTPVVALRRGGAIDTVRDGVSGVLVDSLNANVFASAVTNAALLSGDGPRNQAQKFSGAAFGRHLRQWVDSNS